MTHICGTRGDELNVGIHLGQTKINNQWPLLTKVPVMRKVCLSPSHLTSFSANKHPNLYIAYKTLSRFGHAWALLRECWNPIFPLQWRNNERDGLPNHQPHDSLFNRLFRCRSKIAPKLHVTGLCPGNSPVTGEFPAKRASNAKNVSFDDVIM